MWYFVRYWRKTLFCWFSLHVFVKKDNLMLVSVWNWWHNVTRNTRECILKPKHIKFIVALNFHAYYWAESDNLSYLGKIQLSLEICIFAWDQSALDAERWNIFRNKVKKWNCNNISLLPVANAMISLLATCDILWDITKKNHILHMCTTNCYTQKQLEVCNNATRNTRECIYS